MTSEVILRHGTVEQRVAGRPVRYVDRGGTEAALLAWDGELLRSARLRLPDGGWLEIEPRADDHPLFGACDLVHRVEPSGARGALLSRFAAVDWACPASIPPLEHPGALPAGGGTAILNLVARCAQIAASAASAPAAGRAALRYVGPYPTEALFDSLLDSFALSAASGTPDSTAARAAFTADVELHAFAGAMREATVDFVPAPFERLWQPPPSPSGSPGNLPSGPPVTPAVCVQLRDGVEKVLLAGRAYPRDGAAARRLVRRDGAWVCEVVLAGAPWAERALIADDGTLLAGPLPLPPVASPLVGVPFAAPLVAALAELIAAVAPPLLAPAIRASLPATPILWGDPGDDAATLRGATIIVHAALADRLSGSPLATVAATLANAIAPLAARVAQEHASRGLGDV